MSDEPTREQILAFMTETFGALNDQPTESWREWWLATYGVVVLAYRAGWEAREAA